MNLGTSVKVTLASGATAVGTTVVAGSTLDMSGFEGVLFILQGGTITDGGLGVKASGGAAADGSDKQDLAGTLTSLSNAQDNDVAVLDLFRPTQRYITPQAVRGGSTGAVIQGLIAIQYGAHNKPTVDDATTAPVSKVVISPAVGTA